MNSPDQIFSNPGDTLQEKSLIAVVDDDASVRKATQRLLRSAGFIAEGYSTAEAFLESADGVRTGCLVLDVGLPGMNGLELQQYLARGGSDIPIIFITAESGDDGRIQMRALQSGALAFLRKPYLGADLLQAVETAFARYATRRALGAVG